MVFEGIVLRLLGTHSLLVAPTGTLAVVEVRLVSKVPEFVFDPLYTLVVVHDEVWDNDSKCFVQCRLHIEEVVGEGMFQEAHKG